MTSTNSWMRSVSRPQRERQREQNSHYASHNGLRAATSDFGWCLDESVKLWQQHRYERLVKGIVQGSFVVSASSLISDHQTCQSLKMSLALLFGGGLLLGRRLLFGWRLLCWRPLLFRCGFLLGWRFLGDRGGGVRGGGH